MTAIVPRAGASLTALSLPASPASPGPPEGANRFESFLTPPRGAGPAPRASSGGNLHSEVAHLFNEFGFFAARSAPPEPALQAPSDGPLDGPAPAARSEARSQAHQGAVKPSDERVMTEPAPPVDAPEFEPGAERVGEEVGGSRPAPTSIAPCGAPRAEARVGPPKITSPRIALESRLINEPAWARATLAEPETFAARAAPREGRSTPDRLIFQIGDSHVELVGRLARLGDEEERRLLEALGDLLEAHGFSLRSATLNGRPAAWGLGRGGI